MANSYMVGNAPAGASYTAPLAGFMIGDRLANLPQQYFEGQQRQRQLALQNAFPNGLPQTKDPQTGQQVPDVGAVQNTLLRLGGGEYAEKLMPFLMGQQAASSLGGSLDDADRVAGGQPPRQPAGPQAGPANLGPQRQPAAPGAPTPGPPGPPAIDKGSANTLRGIATETAGGNRDISTYLPRWAKGLGVDPDQELSPEQITAARSIVGRTLSSMAGGQPPLGNSNPAILPGGPSDSEGGGVAPTPASGVSGSPGPSTGPSAPRPAGAPSNRAPFAPGPRQPPGAPGAPQPGQPPGLQPQQSGPIASPETPPTSPTAPGSGSPQQLQQTAQNLRTAAEIVRRKALQLLANPATKEIGEKAMVTAADYTKRAEQIEQTLLKAQEPQLTANASGYENPAEAEAAKNSATDRVKAYSQKGSAIAAAGESARESMPRLQLAMSIANDPGFTSGPGSSQQLAYRRIMASPWAQKALSTISSERRQIGMPDIAAPDEAFHAIMQREIFNDVKAIQVQGGTQGGSAGRGAGAFIDLLEHGSASAANTVWGNRMLLAMSQRAKQRMIDLDRMRQNYRGDGTIDNGFDKLIDAYDQGKLSKAQMQRFGLQRQGPIFSDEEQQEPRLIGAPSFKSEREMLTAKLPHGQPFRWADGSVGYMQ